MRNGNNGLREENTASSSTAWDAEHLDKLEGKEAEQFFAELDVAGNKALGLNPERPSGASKVEPFAFDSWDAKGLDELKGEKAKQFFAELDAVANKAFGLNPERPPSAQEAEPGAPGSWDAKGLDGLKGEKAKQFFAEFDAAAEALFAADNEGSAKAAKSAGQLQPSAGPSGQSNVRPGRLQADHLKEGVPIPPPLNDDRVYWGTPGSQTKSRGDLFDDQQFVSRRQNGKDKATLSYFLEEESSPKPDTKVARKFRAAKWWAKKEKTQKDAERRQDQLERKKLQEWVDEAKKGRFAHRADIQHKRIAREEQEIDNPRRCLPHVAVAESSKHGNLPDSPPIRPTQPHQIERKPPAQVHENAESSGTRSQRSETGLDNRSRGRENSL